MRPKLYWISGSAPSWRVMLALVLKGVPFDSQPLDHGAGENRLPEYMALNPKGQVPTLVAGDLVIRESIAILAWLDRAYPDRPIWGEDPTAAAMIWQDVAEMEADIRAPIALAAGILLRGEIDRRAEDLREASAKLVAWADTLSERLGSTPYLGGAHPMASDIWVYPALHWLARASVRAGAATPPEICQITDARPNLTAWSARIAALPGVAGTCPPHWREG